MSRSRGPISDEEHARCVAQFDYRYDLRVVPALADTPFHCRGRYHESWDAPCLYLYWTAEDAAAHRNAVAHIQTVPRSKDVQVVFRKWNGDLPLSRDDWMALKPDVWEPSQDNRRAFRIAAKGDVPRANALLKACAERYETRMGG